MMGYHFIRSTIASTLFAASESFSYEDIINVLRYNYSTFSSCALDDIL